MYTCRSWSTNTGTAGLVTIEDILEEIVGEITDEYDNEVPEVEELATDRYRVSARLGVDDLAELVPVQVSSEGEDVDTVGGLLGRRLGWFRSPEPMSISMATGSPPSGRRDGVTGSVPSWSRNCRAARSNESGGRETTDPGTSCPRADRRCAGCGGPRRDGPQLHRRPSTLRRCGLARSTSPSPRLWPRVRATRKQWSWSAVWLPDLSVVTDLGGPGVPVWLCDSRGSVIGSSPS